MSKDLPSSLQQHGNCIRSAFYIRTTQLPSGHTNAAAESFWARLQTELLDRQRWRTRVELANAIFEYIERFYNRRRRHSALDWMSPIEFETTYSPDRISSLASP
jgi:putative transposase